MDLLRRTVLKGAGAASALALLLAAAFECAEGMVAEIAVRLKLADSSVVEAVVGTSDRHYALRRQVNITMSGCEH